MLLPFSISSTFHLHWFSHNKIIFEDLNISHWATANSNEYKSQIMSTVWWYAKCLGSTICELCDLEQLAYFICAATASSLLCDDNNTWNMGFFFFEVKWDNIMLCNSECWNIIIIINSISSLCLCCCPPPIYTSHSSRRCLFKKMKTKCHHCD